MISFIFGILLLGGAAVAFAYWKRPTRPFGGLGWISIALVVIGVAFVGYSFFFQVPPREEAIPTSFGAISGHYKSGPHLKAPWWHIHYMDAAKQTDTFIDPNPKDGVCQALTVRIAAQQTGCANVTIRWRIEPGAAEELYKDWRSFNHVRDALITTQIRNVLNEKFGNYNPLNIATEPNKREESLTEIAAAVKQGMAEETKGELEILTLSIPIVTFDEAVQARINQLQQQVALTKIADERLKTNKAEALANNALAKSVNDRPNILVARCLDTLELMVKSHDTIPAGFSCWPGNGVAGVIAGGK